MSLKVKLLEPGAKVPTCSHPGEDLAFDLYALQDTLLLPAQPSIVKTGIAAQFRSTEMDPTTFYSHITNYGLLIRDRSSMASKGITVSGGVIDSGYSGEILVVMRLEPSSALRVKFGSSDHGTIAGYQIKAGDKIAQMIPLRVCTGEPVQVIQSLDGARAAAGFGSSGR